MRTIFTMATFLIATISYAQDYPTKTIKERLSGVKKTKRIYDVLTKDRTIRHGTYIETFKKDTIVQGQYFLNEKDGAWVYQDTKGLYLQKCFFNKGKKVGDWIAYIEGKLVSREYYSTTSRLDSLFRYDFEGVLAKKYMYNPKDDTKTYWEQSSDGSLKEIRVFDEVAFFTEISKPLTLVQKPPKLFQNADVKSHDYRFHKKALSNCISTFSENNLSPDKLLWHVDDAPGVYRAMVLFKVDVYGEVSDVKVRSKMGRSMENHIKEVLRKMPTFVPAYQNERFVNLMFTFPITLRVEQKYEDPFKNM